MGFLTAFRMKRSHFIVSCNGRGFLTASRRERSPFIVSYTGMGFLTSLRSVRNDMILLNTGEGSWGVSVEIIITKLIPYRNAPASLPPPIKKRLSSRAKRGISSMNLKSFELVPLVKGKRVRSRSNFHSEK